MKSIATVNYKLPTVKDYISYNSGKSLMDYDIILVDPEMPYQDRIDFSGGGSCITIDGTKRLKSTMSHWLKEFDDALKGGKTIFVLVNENITDSGANSYTTTGKGGRLYQSSSINNYDILPVEIATRNTKGKHLKIIDNRFKALYDAIIDIIEYKGVFTSEVNKKIFTTKDGLSVVSAIIKSKEGFGNIVFLPYFDIGKLSTYDVSKRENVWTESALRVSKIIVNQLVEIDRVLRAETEETPKPDWVELVKQPQIADVLDERIRKYEQEIKILEEKKSVEINSKNELLKYNALLYENGKNLELAIENSLKLIGYSVENFQKGDIEIDHIITYSNGIRMIGESEGKDNAAIDISKFRQLETNINEDFSRDEVIEPAKGLLFGNAFRLTEPIKRGNQFTQKCLTNAKRLGTALIKTTDLYEIVMYLIDNPKDEKFKKSCRKVIENTEGDIVTFPKPPIKP